MKAVSDKQGKHLPFISVIIPTYNRPQQLANCLVTLVDVDYPKRRFEVIVVVDGKNDPKNKLAVSPHPTLNFTILTQSHAGPAVARNFGASHAQGDFLLFTDDDCLVKSDWLLAMADIWQKTIDCAIAGRTENGLPDNIYLEASELLVRYLLENGEGRFFTSNCAGMPAKTFHNLGGFDESFALAGGEDRELAWRWVTAGHKIVVSSEVGVVHAHVLDFGGFYRQHFHYGQGAYQFRQKTVRLQASKLTFYIQLLLFPLKKEKNVRGLRLFFLFIVSQIAVVMGLCRQFLALNFGQSNEKDS